MRSKAPRTEVINVRVTPEENRIAHLLARAEGVNRSELVRQLLERRARELEGRSQ